MGSTKKMIRINQHRKVVPFLLPRPLNNKKKPMETLLESLATSTRKPRALMKGFVLMGTLCLFLVTPFWIASQDYTVRLRRYAILCIGKLVHQALSSRLWSHSSDYPNSDIHFFGVLSSLLSKLSQLLKLYHNTQVVHCLNKNVVVREVA